MSDSCKPRPQSPELALLSNCFGTLCDEAGWTSFLTIAGKLKISAPTVAAMIRGHSFPLSTTLRQRAVHKTLAKHAPKAWNDPAIGDIINNYIEKDLLPPTTEPTTTKIDSDKTAPFPQHKANQTTHFGCPLAGGPACQALCKAFLTLCAEAGWHTKLDQSKHISMYYQAFSGIHASTRFPTPETLKKSGVLEIFAKAAPQAWENPSIGGLLFDYIERGNVPAVDLIKTHADSIEEPRFDRDGLPPELSHQETAPYGLDPFAAPIEREELFFPSLPVARAKLPQKSEPTPQSFKPPVPVAKEIPALAFEQAKEHLCDNLYSPLDGQKNYRDIALCLKDVIKTHLDRTPATDQDGKLWHSLLRYMEEKPVIPKPSFLLLLGLPDVLAAPYNMNTPQIPLLIDYVFPDIEQKQAALRKLAIDIHHKVGAAQNRSYPSKPAPLMVGLRPRANQLT